VNLGGLGEQPLIFQTAVGRGNEFSIAIVDLGWTPLACAKHILACLASARVRDSRIDIGPKAIFLTLLLFPEGLRSLRHK